MNTMDRVTVVNYCLGLLGLLLLQGVLDVEGRSIFNPGRCAKSACFRSLYNENAAEDATTAPLKLEPLLV